MIDRVPGVAIIGAWFFWEWRGVVQSGFSRVRILFLAGVLALSGCTGEDLLGQGILVVGLESNPTNLDPRIATDAASSRTNQLIYRGLLCKDESGQVVADLAETWEQLDPTHYRFRIRPGIRFHDGRLLEAEDVRYTFDSLLGTDLASPLRGTYQAIASVRCPDRQSVLFHLQQPNASFPVSLDLGIVPRPDSPEEERAYRRLPVGCGPFRFVSWEQGHEIRLVANPGYPEGPPRIRELRFKIIPDNTVRVLELRKGSVHLIQNDFQPEVLPILERDGRFTILRGEGTHYSYLGFNLKDPILGPVRVRQAIAHALDREAIIKYLLGGLAVEATGLLSPMNWAYEGQVKKYPYDPGLAKALLDAAGYPDPDGDGPRKRFVLTYKTSQNDLRRRIAEAIQGQLDAVGVDVHIRSYEWGTFFADIQKQNFQMYALTWVGVTDPDIYTYIFSTRNVPPQGANRGRYENPEIDRLLEGGRGVQDPESRKKIYSRVQKILAEELPYVSLWHGMNVAVMDQRIRGFTLYPNGDLISLKEAWIE